MGQFIQTYGGQLITVAGTLLGTWLGYRMRTSDEMKSKKQRVRALWGAISAEIEVCKRKAVTYLAPNDQGQRITAPQWRLPDLMLKSSLQALLADGDPEEAEVDALLNYHSEVETLNRGLDLAQEVAGGAAEARRRMDVNDLKARRLIDGGEYYAPLRPLIDRHLAR